MALKATTMGAPRLPSADANACYLIGDMHKFRIAFVNTHPIGRESLRSRLCICPTSRSAAIAPAN